MLAWPKGVPYFKPNSVKSIRVSLPTPRQRYQGYDRQVIITATSGGNVGLSNVRLNFSRNGKKGFIPITVSRDFYWPNVPMRMVLPLKLSQVPAEYGQLTLSGDVLLSDFSWNFDKNARYKRNSAGERIRVPTPADRIKVVVRRAGQKITPPSVNTNRPFRLGEAKVLGPSLFASPAQLNLRQKPTASPRRTSASVFITLRDTQGGKRQPGGEVTFDNVQLVTAKGEIHPLMDGKHGQIITQLTNDIDPKRDEPIRYFFSCNFKHIPFSEGHTFFRAAISVSDCWPLPVSVRVR